MKNEILLNGCHTTPLASYLKGLGVFRIIAEQKDPSACARWEGNDLIIETSLDEDELVSFFTDRYQPTPLVAPWGARSGFYSGSSENAARSALEAIERSSTPRLRDFREVIYSVKDLLIRFGFNDKPSDEGKLRLMELCRAELPDNIVDWLDACYVLTTDSRRFPPLLGTGGNEGSGSYVSGFSQQVVRCLLEANEPGLVNSALFGAKVPATHSNQTPGQFSPFDSGGPNQSSSFSASVQTNPWSYLLLLEGTLMLTSSATRRHDEISPSRASFPFTVEFIGSTSGNTSIPDEGDARAEIWMPIWKNKMTYMEVRAFLSEGRVSLRGNPVRNGLDFARAISTLGVDRGIVAFQRHVIAKRFGLSKLAVPMDRIPVKRNSSADLLEDLDHRNWWLSFAKTTRTQPTSQIISLSSRLDKHAFELSTNPDGQTPPIEPLLRVLGGIHQYLAARPKARESCSPIPQLSEDWFTHTNDNSTEFQIAAAVAGLHARLKAKGGHWIYRQYFRRHIAPEKDLDWPEWDEEHDQDVTLGHGGPAQGLARTLVRRLIVAEQEDHPDKPLRGRCNASLGAISAWLAGDVHERRLDELMRGLALVRLPRYDFQDEPETAPLPVAYRLLKPLFATDEQLERCKLTEPGTHVPLSREIPRRLMRGDTDGAVAMAMRRLRIAGIGDLPKSVDTSGVNGPRLLAALMTPISDPALKQLLPKQQHLTEQTEETA